MPFELVRNHGLERSMSSSPIVAFLPKTAPPRAATPVWLSDKALSHHRGVDAFNYRTELIGRQLELYKAKDAEEAGFKMQGIIAERDKWQRLAAQRAARDDIAPAPPHQTFGVFHTGALGNVQKFWKNDLIVKDGAGV